MSGDTAGPQNVAADICVCTFQRASLADTLSSLFGLALRPDWLVRVIVADNDALPSAQPIVEQAACKAPFPVLYVHAPMRNISVARNACLDAATARFVAFIDDDELATPLWLAALIDRQAQASADVVLGPVRSHYPGKCAGWLRRGDFHSIKPVWVDGEIITGYTSNVLIVRDAAALRGLRFDPKLGRSGGEDTMFFTAVHRAGGRIDYAPEAVVTEDVATERLNFRWLAQRYFRSGQTHGLILLGAKRRGRISRLGSVALAGGKATLCGIVAAACLVTGGRVRFWCLRGIMHAGVVSRLLGVSELIQYG